MRKERQLFDKNGYSTIESSLGIRNGKQDADGNSDNDTPNEPQGRTLSTLAGKLFD